MRLYHFSEEPDIQRFEPRVAPTSIVDEPLVWAIDEAHAPMYYVPRQCPRACFWAGEGTSKADRERWFSHVSARMVIAVESRWLQRIRTAGLYRYTMPEATFVPRADDDSGHYISREAVVPLSVEPVGDLLAALVDAGIELRVTPSLVELWRQVTASTLHFSGTRLRNAHDWPVVFP